MVTSAAAANEAGRVSANGRTISAKFTTPGPTVDRSLPGAILRSMSPDACQNGAVSIEVSLLDFSRHVP
jgi:hypothetical protein